MKIAVIGPSFHNKTQSSAFFIDVLRQLGTVDVLWDESWTNEPQYWLAHFDPSIFDCIIIWQWSILLPNWDEVLNHENVIIVPMYDHTVRSSGDLWPTLYRHFKIICLSSTLFEEVTKYTSRAIFVRYFPDPANLGGRCQCSGGSGFFWRRTNQVTETMIAALCGNFVFDNFTLHWCPDPSPRAPLAAVNCPIRTRKLVRTSWFSSKSEYLEVLRQHNLFFAPRHFEGVGMAFLEAMSMGLCVVAPDTPTHNEYINNGINGLLYSSLEKLEIADINELGNEARASMVQGHAAWRQSIDYLCSFIVG
jgi:Glycosyl transferases group 1